MAPVIQFRRAVKYDAKGRVALIGPPGSGKSFTLLKLARQLAGPNGKIAAIDTEHGSLSKYADVFEFDTFEMDSYTPDNFMAAIPATEDAKYDVFCCDSLSHFWMGKDGALEFVDLAAKKHRDNMGGWKEFRPHERAMVDAMIASPCHVIVTMRTKTEYVEEVDPSTGKKQRRKVGLAPVQRDGLEYEMDLVGYMDEDNTLIVDKTRCSFYAGKAIAKPSEKDFAPFVEWLKGERKTEGTPAQVAKPMPAPPAATQQGNGKHHDIPTTTNNGGVKSPSAMTTDGGIDANPAGRGTSVKSPTPPAAAPYVVPPTTVVTPPVAPPAPLISQAVVDMWTAMGRSKKEFFEVFADLKTSFRELIGEHGESNYRVILQRHGVEHSNQFKSLSKARSCAKEMWESIQLIASAPPANPEIADDDVPFGDAPQGVLIDTAAEPPSPYSSNREVA